MFGLLYDLSGTTPLGLVALCYGLGGMTAGYVHTLVSEPQWWLASMFAVVGAAVGELSVPFAGQMIGDEGWITPRLLDRKADPRPSGMWETSLQQFADIFKTP